MIRTLTFAFILAAGCGGQKPAPASTPQAVSHEEHSEMPAEMTKFHDVLAPRWHAEKGPQRMKETCAAMPEFSADADTLAKATPPSAANADSWTSSTKALVDAVAGLAATCKANDATKFEEAFHQVHESFHGLMAAAGIHHEGGEEHEHMGGDEHEHKM